MRSFYTKLKSDSKNDKAFAWLKLISITGSSEILVQAVGFFSGILVVRLLPNHEYGLYTLATTMLGTMLILADGGISTGVMAKGARVHDDPKKLGTVVATGFDLRKKFAVGSLLIAVPILFYQLYLVKASLLMTVLITVSLIPTFMISLSTNLYEIVAKIKQDIPSLQKIKVGMNLGRLIVLSLTVFAFPLAWVAMIISGIPQLWENRRLRLRASGYSDFDQKPDPVVRQEILKMVKLILPGALYYSISGQIAIFIISFSNQGEASTEIIAALGALNKIAVVLSLFSVLFHTLIAPRFAKLPDDKTLILKRFTQAILVLIIPLCIIIGLVFLFSTQILWVLGDSYKNLNKELFMNIIASCIGLIATCSYSLYTYRGWNINPIISIAINIISITVSALLFDLSTIKGLLYMNIFIATIVVIMNMVFVAFKIKGLDMKDKLS